MSNIKILSQYLKPDYPTSYAVNGFQALDMANSENVPDLILLDIMMPEMDDFEVCRRLKSEDRTKNIPVIFVTAKISEADEKRGLELGAVDYVIKPFNPVLVKARVRTQLELKKYQDHLQTIVFERTKELTRVNEQLRAEISELIAAQKEQEKLHKKRYRVSKLEAIGTMAGIAHDFNNIVGAILLNTELAVDDITEGTEARYCMEQIIKICQRAMDLVNQILTFSRESEETRKPLFLKEVLTESWHCSNH